jgi:hypothetical protein
VKTSTKSENIWSTLRWPDNPEIVFCLHLFAYVIKMYTNSKNVSTNSIFLTNKPRHGPKKSQSTFLASVIWENSGNHFLWLLSFHKKCEQKNLTHNFEDTKLLTDAKCRR